MASHHAQRKLGELLVDNGVMDNDTLEDALLEQQVSRKRLGAILVSAGAISPPDLTAALTAQLEGTPAAAEAHRENADLIGEAKRTRRGLFRRRSSAPEQGAPQESESLETVNPRRSHLETVDVALLQELQSLMRRHLDGLRANFEQAGKDLEAARLEIVARNERVADLEARLAGSERERQQLVDALQVEISRSKTALDECRFEACVPAAPPTNLSIAAGAHTNVGVRAASHLLLVPDGAGSHSLRACAGDPPDVGTRVVITGKPFVAVSHGRSPFDGDARVCVQLEAR